MSGDISMLELASRSVYRALGELRVSFPWSYGFARFAGICGDQDSVESLAQLGGGLFASGSSRHDCSIKVWDQKEKTGECVKTLDTTRV